MGRHTFKELLACVLLEECFVENRAVEIVNHKLEDRLNLFFRVAGVMCESRIL